MKKRKKQEQEFLFEQIDRKGDLGFDYADIKNRINLLQYAKKPDAKMPARHFRPQIFVTACSLLLVTTAIGFGGFMMSRRGTVIEPDTTTGEETMTIPESPPLHQLPVLYPEDTLLWQGEVYIRTDMKVAEEAVGEQLGKVLSEIDPQSPHIGRDNPHVAIAEHIKDGTPFHQVEDKNYIAVLAEDGYIIYQKQFNTDTETT